VSLVWGLRSSVRRNCTFGNTVIDRTSPKRALRRADYLSHHVDARDDADCAMPGFGGCMCKPGGAPPCGAGNGGASDLRRPVSVANLKLVGRFRVVWAKTRPRPITGLKKLGVEGNVHQRSNRSKIGAQNCTIRFGDYVALGNVPCSEFRIRGLRAGA